ncbi:5-(carboxyamino)imidazole ribonucleotide mutase [Acididesulfobacillus acetoxydans]|uniref:5-(carboxyamino)imidazole ribonucleotide mutase n=1 Tax=Acididesulfobacillus acetoxydans TaxID=1561005 RepID=UPI001F0E769C|nr:5-(carboxyamino)imidazole ribonucleotide mutase [Acididesulfobacillus acetoxydans]
MSLVGIVMGSDSDYPVVEETIKVLDRFKVPYEVKVSSAHRTLERTLSWVKNFESQGGQVIVAAAGLAAHLPGVVAGSTSLPVIGLPIASGSLSGVDALYAIVQMPPGVPVATVGIGAARNAGLLAVQILAAGRESLRSALQAYRRELAEEVERKDSALLAKLREKTAVRNS